MTEYSFEDRISRSPEAKRQRAMSRGVVPTSIYNNEEKIIKSIQIKNSSDIYANAISSFGGYLPIVISGTKNSMFSLTITDSSGCSILKEEINNQIINDTGVYSFLQKFPSISSVKSSKGKIPKETYTITVTPSADTKFSSYLDNNPYVITIEQFVKSKITITHYENSITGLTFTASAKSQTGEANQTNNYQGYTNVTFPIAVKYSSYSSGNIYVKSTDFNNNIIKNNTITGIVDRDGQTGSTNCYHIGIDSNNDYVGGVVKELVGKNFEERVKDTVSIGTKASFKITNEKFVISSLDKNDNVIDFDNCKNKRTKIFKLNNTNDIKPGMLVKGDNISTIVESVSSCGQKITFFKDLIIKPHTNLTFIRKDSLTVSEATVDNSKGKLKVFFKSFVDIPDGTIITFDDDDSIVKGTISQTGSGNTGNGDANDIDLTCTVSIKKFGNKPELVYALDMSKIISKKPNAYDQSVVTAKNTTIAIDMIKFDTDTNRTSKTGTVVRPPSHGTVSAYNTIDDAFAYLPNNNFVGSDSFTFTMSDGTNTSDEKTILIEVLEGASGVSDTLSGGGG